METLIAVILFLIFMLVEGWLAVWFLFRRAAWHPTRHQAPAFRL